MNNMKKLIRVVLFASAYAGEAILHSFLTDETLLNRCQVSGVVRDDPANPVCNAEGRTWKYLDQEELPLRVERLAQKHRIPTYCETLQSKSFQQEFADVWRPDLVVCSFFGQQLSSAYLAVPPLGAVNVHPCFEDPLEVWPSAFAGVMPVTRVLAAGHCSVRLAAHFMNESFDEGPVIASSPSVPVDDAEDAATTHANVASHIARFLTDVTTVLIGQRLPQTVRPPSGYADFGSVKSCEEVIARNPYLDFETIKKLPEGLRMKLWDLLARRKYFDG